jgi:hypothetical protein
MNLATPRRGRRRRLGRFVVAAGVLASGALLVAAPVGASPGQDVVTITEGSTPQGLVDSLLGGGITVSNVTYTGDNQAAGTFSGMDAIGFGSGIVLSSGMADEVVGPNLIENNSTEFGLPGDPSLDALVAPDTTNDASVLQFDFVPAAATVRFEYVFGSEEYNDFVNSEFNDVFAFLVNGTNCATIPGTNPALPVSINNVNGGNPAAPVPVDASNPQFYRNNSTEDPGPPTIDTELDGLTTVFTCEATVTPNVTNTLKLAVADTSDEALDTSVFIRSRSLEVNLPPTCAAASATVQQGDAVPVTLSATDPNPNDTISYTIATQPTHGTLTGTPPSVSYQSDVAYSGADSFTFTASDGTNTCTGTVSITVTPIPPPVTQPVAAVPVVVVTPRFTG